MINLIGVLIAIFISYLAMYLSALATGSTTLAYVDLVSFLLCFGIPYGCSLAAFGKLVPNLDGMKLMNKLFMPAAWLGAIIGWVMMLRGIGGDVGEDFVARFSLSMAVSILTLLYGIMLKVIFTTLIASKK